MAKPATGMGKGTLVPPQIYKVFSRNTKQYNPLYGRFYVVSEKEEESNLTLHPYNYILYLA